MHGLVAKGKNHKNGLLASNLIYRLEILPGWSWDPYEEDFIFGLSKCREYYLQNGHLNPTTNSKNAEKMPCGFKIGQWVAVQRSQKDNLQKSRPDRYQALIDIPGWQWTGKVDLWHEKYSILTDFVSKYGHAKPKPKDVHKGVKIGGLGFENNGCLENGRSSQRRERELLEALPGWSWGSAMREAWEKGVCSPLIIQANLWAIVMSNKILYSMALS